MQNFVGKTKCIAGYMKVANSYMYTLGDGANPSSKWRLHTKVKIITVSLGIEIENKTFKLFTCVY